MIKLSCKVPDRIEIALSGGPDSTAALYFFKNSGRDVSAAFFHHGTETSEKSYLYVEHMCKQLDVPLRMAKITHDPEKYQNLEAAWREERYKFFEAGDRPVITAHHLDDAVEWWIFSSLHGEGKLIPRVRDRFLRPFLLSRKEALIDICKKNEACFWEDKTNFLIDRPRVLIRNKMIYDCLKINPGIHKVIKKKYLKEIENERSSR